jgi:hypothetical protein
VSQPFVGPLPYPALPEQPTFPTWSTQWKAYDVPRLWDIVRLENDQLGWDQINGFRQLSDLLVDQYRRLRTQWEHLGAAWAGPAADVYLSRLDSFCVSLLADGHCASTTANALHGIMSTFASARTKIGALAEDWDHVTSDWVPEWWDQAASELNAEAAKVMLDADISVRDHRSRIIIPDQTLTTIDHASGLSAIPAALTDQVPSYIPPVPGYAPSIQSAGHSEALLAGLPPIAPAVPGQPVSMLPIPPGSQLLPYGGAYVLPGPGVGPGGYVIPMPGHVFSGQDARFSAVPTQGAVSGSVVPLPLTATPNVQGASGQLYRRRNTVVWHVDKGVPPVIEPVDDRTMIPNQPTVQQEEAFKEWFAELAYPWRANARSTEPQVILRRVPT